MPEKHMSEIAGRMFPPRPWAPIHARAGTRINLKRPRRLEAMRRRGLRRGLPRRDSRDDRPIRRRSGSTLRLTATSGTTSTRGSSARSRFKR